MKRLLASLLVMLCAFSVSACGDNGDPRGPELDGAWSGFAQGFTVSLTLSSNGPGVITGSGTLSAGGAVISLTVRNGIHSHPNVSLTLGGEGYEDLNYSATFSEDALIGTLNGSGFSNFGLTLTR